MKQLLGPVGLLIVLLTIQVANPARASQQPRPHDPPNPTVSADNNSFNAGVSAGNDASSAPAPAVPGAVAAADTAAVPGHDVTMDVCDLNGEAVCDNTCPDGSIKVVTYFLSDTGTTSNFRDSCPSAGPTLGDIRNAFRQIPMHPSRIHIQPPRGETLVNFDTIFYTDPYTLDTSVTLLGATVAFHITVASYTWHYGDGHTQTTTDPGAPFPDQTITHRYLKKGTVDVTLATTYQADYSINGGPTQHLTDTVTITSPPQQLTVLTATPHLVAN